jgi:hypothetical protein
MPAFTRALRAWPEEDFSQVLTQELEQWGATKSNTGRPGANLLPLDKLTTQGGVVDYDAIKVMVLSTKDTEEVIIAKLGVFFTEIVICCGCGDDPMPVNAYGELCLSLNKQTAEASLELLAD